MRDITQLFTDTFFAVIIIAQYHYCHIATEISISQSRRVFNIENAGLKLEKILCIFMSGNILLSTIFQKHSFSFKKQAFSSRLFCKSSILIWFPQHLHWKTAVTQQMMSEMVMRKKCPRWCLRYWSGFIITNITSSGSWM